MKAILLLTFVIAVNGLAPLYTQKDRILGSYIVQLKEHVDPKDAIATIQSSPLFSSLGGRVDREYSVVLKGFAATLSEKALELVRGLDYVELVEEDQMMYALEQWNLDRVDGNTNNVYEPKGNGNGVSVYVIDTGINMDHDDFTGRAHTNSSMDFCSSNNNGIDCNGHGTHCAGIVGGETYGVAKLATIYGVRVLGCWGSGSTSDIINGMEYVGTRTGKRIASMSVGGGASVTMDNAVTGLYEAGVPVIVAAGNGNHDACDVSPARAEKAYTIGSIDSTNTIASSSNYGSCVNLFAPGVSIESTTHSSNKGTTTMSGTSMATPHVAGGATFECGEDSCDPDQVYSALSDNSIPNVIEGLTSSKSSSPNRLLNVG